MQKFYAAGDNQRVSVQSDAAAGVRLMRNGNALPEQGNGFAAAEIFAAFPKSSPYFRLQSLLPACVSKSAEWTAPECALYYLYAK